MKTDGQVHYHIHFDGLKIQPQLAEWALGNGFWWDNFMTEHDGRPHGYEPNLHLTNKLQNASEFRKVSAACIGVLESNPTYMEGYLECEVIIQRHEIPVREFSPSARFPFKVELGSLPKGEFRESEIHISMSEEKSDSRLFKALEGAGLFAAYKDSPAGRRVIYTVQGCRKDMVLLWKDLESYLQSAGGAVEGKMKEECIYKHWLCSPEYPLPPIAQNIVYL
jgi:hypothetical protein